MYIIGTGLLGGYGILRQVVWLKIFKEKNVSSILGVVYCSSTIAGEVGVSIFSFANTQLESYFYLIRMVEGILLCMILFAIRKFYKAESNKASDIKIFHLF
jgi:hypothetical protein